MPSMPVSSAVLGLIRDLFTTAAGETRHENRRASYQAMIDLIDRDLARYATPAPEPWCDHDPSAIVAGICECGAVWDHTTRTWTNEHPFGEPHFTGSVIVGDDVRISGSGLRITGSAIGPGARVVIDGREE